MKVKFFYPDRDGNIKFTREQLEKLLNDIYDEGKEDGRRECRPYYYINSPSEPPTPIYYYNTPIWKYDSVTTTTSATPSIFNIDYEPRFSSYDVYCTNEDAIGRITLDIDRETISNTGDTYVN